MYFLCIFLATQHLFGLITRFADALNKLSLSVFPFWLQNPFDLFSCSPLLMACSAFHFLIKFDLNFLSRLIPKL